MLDEFTIDMFRPMIGARFRIATPAGELEVTLTEAAPVMVSEAARLPRQPFSLVFEGPKEPLLRQGTYPISCDAFAAVEIFIVPLQPTFTAARYEAVFA